MTKLTNRQVIYDFKDLMSKDRLSDDIGYSNRWIYNHLLNYRAQLLIQKLDKDKLSELNYQTIPNINVIEVPDTDFKCIPPMKCVLLRSEVPIPSYIDLKSITSPLNKSGEIIKFTEIDPDMIKYKLLSKLPAQLNNTYYYIQNIGNGAYVYIWSNKIEFLKGIAIKGIFHRPHLVEAINDCAGNINPCYNYLDAEFPIDPELLSTMYAMALSSIMKGKVMATDLINDNNDTITTNQQ